jgi:hypothetical protein
MCCAGSGCWRWRAQAGSPTDVLLAGFERYQLLRATHADFLRRLSRRASQILSERRPFSGR